MSNVINTGRQNPLVLDQSFDHQDFDVAPSGVKLKLPVNALILRASTIVDVAFGASATLAIGPSGSTTKYGSAVDLNTVGATSFTAAQLNKLLSSGETILLTPNANAISASAGSGRIIVEYIIVGRSQEVQP